MQPNSNLSHQGFPGASIFNPVIEKLIDDRVNLALESKLSLLINNPLFLKLLKEELGIAPPQDEFIDIPAVCSLLKISRTTCYNRSKDGILIPYRTEGSTRVMFSRKQVLSTLKAAKSFKRQL